MARGETREEERLGANLYEMQKYLELIIWPKIWLKWNNPPSL